MNHQCPVNGHRYLTRFTSSIKSGYIIMKIYFFINKSINAVLSENVNNLNLL